MNIKAHLSFALKVLVAFIIINAILELLGLFTSTAFISAFIYKPIATLKGLGGSATNSGAA